MSSELDDSLFACFVITLESHIDIFNNNFLLFIHCYDFAYPPKQLSFFKVIATIPNMMKIGQHITSAVQHAPYPSKYNSRQPGHQSSTVQTKQISVECPHPTLKASSKTPPSSPSHAPTPTQTQNS